MTVPLLGTGESVLRKARAVSASGQHGELFLTTDRLIFEAPKASGLRHRHLVSKVFSVMLTDLVEANVSKPFLGSPVLRIEAHGVDATLRLEEAGAWYDAIVKAREAAFAAPRAAPQSAVPTARETHTVERQVIKVRCRYCGNLTDEIAGKCASCGAKL